MTDRAALLDSRRLTGPSRLLDRPGVVIDVQLPAATADALIGAWRTGAAAILEAVGWGGERLATLRWNGGASLGHTAPLDALYSATDVNEWAWSHAIGDVEGGDVEPVSLAGPRLVDRIDAERRPALLELSREAARHGVQLLVDNHLATVGSGDGACTFELSALPQADTIDWPNVHSVPTALVTGSNGKTTTVRLLAAMLKQDGRRVGYSCTDGVSVMGESLAVGDYSGPEGARLLLRDRRVGVAVLETARGGLLRRGLPVTHAEVAVVTNIAADHFGEYGIQTLGDLTDAKLVVAKALDSAGWLVLSADDPELVRVGGSFAATVAWFSLDSGNAVVQRSMAAGNPVGYLDGGRLTLRRGSEAIDLGAAAAAPLTLGGTARYNIANAIAASLAAWRLGCAPDAMRTALGTFGRSNADNPGRANLFTLGGVQILLDYAHNPHGVDALVEVAAALPATRRAVVLGQAGDRDDEAIRGLARSAWAMHPDVAFLKEMTSYLRGRAAGEVPALMREELEQLGMAPSDIIEAPSELAAVQRALDWSRKGDLLVLTVHNDRGSVLALLDRLEAEAWHPAA